MNKIRRYIAFGNKRPCRIKYIKAVQNQTRLEQTGWKNGTFGGILTSRRMNARQRRAFKKWGFVAAKYGELENLKVSRFEAIK